MNFWDKYQLYFYVTVLVLLTWWLQELYQEREASKKVAENSPDFYSRVYFKQTMDLNGLPKSELKASNMLHYKMDGSTHLEQPMMTLYKAGAAPWVIQAENGIMAADGEHLQLQGHTLISREAHLSDAALQVNTSDLSVVLPDNFAETSAWAEIVSPPHKTEGIGMEVTFVSPIHLKLLSKVKGRYEVK